MAVLGPPLAFALAADSPEAPSGRGLVYEPKVDGWRIAGFAAAGVLQSRSGKDLAHRFPEILAAVARIGDVVVDGELVAWRGGSLDFAALAAPPARRAAAGTAVYLVAFDLVSVRRRDLRSAPYSERREYLAGLLGEAEPGLVQLCPATHDRAEAVTAWMSEAAAGAGIEGVVTKAVTSPYRPGRSGDWRKTRYRTVVDVVVVGVTGDPARPEALVLAMPDDRGELRAVGLSLPLPRAVRGEVGARLVPVDGPRRTLPGVVSGLPGHAGTVYVPVLPTLTVEVIADPQAEYGRRFRHRPRFWRVGADHPGGLR